MLSYKTIFLFLCALSIKNVGLMRNCHGVKLHPASLISFAVRFYFGKTIRSSDTGQRIQSALSFSFCVLRCHQHSGKILP